MLADGSRETAAEKGAEKSSEKATDRSPLKADDVMSAQNEAAANYKTDVAKRAEEYSLGLDRGTGSHRFLPSSLEIVDGLKKLVGKITRAIGGEEIPTEAKSATTVKEVNTPDEAVTPAEAPHRNRALESGVEAAPENKPESSLVTRDDQNRPTAIEYPDGKINKIEYDNDGQPALVYARDGSTVMCGGDHWNIVKDGKITRWDGEIQVSENGDITCKRLDGGIKVRNVDGSETITEPPASGDHLVETKAGFEPHAVMDAPRLAPENRDITIKATDSGNVTDIVGPGGKKTHVEYVSDHDKTPKTVELPDGDKWKLDPDGKGYTLYHGNQEGSTHCDKIEVEPNGDLVYHDVHPEGVKTGPDVTVHPDGSTITKTPDYLKVAHPDGTYYEAKYQDGNLVSITDGTNTWKPTPDGGWDVYDKQGNPGHLNFKEVTIDTNGDTTFSFNDGSTITKKCNGYEENIHVDGEEVVIKNAIGKVIETKNEDGATTYEYDTDGTTLKKITMPDGSTIEKDGDGYTQHIPAEPAEPGKPGKPAKTFHSKCKMSVTESGDIKAENADGTILVTHLDGTSEFTEKSGITKDDTGKITKIKYPADAGGEVQFQYDQSDPPALKFIVVENGNYYAKDEPPGDGYTKYKDGKPSEHYDSIEIDKDTGDVKLHKNSDKGSTDIWHPNGSNTYTYFDNVPSEKTTVIRDEHGYVTEIQNKDGSSKYEHDKDGNLTKITYPDKSTIERDKDGGGYTLYDAGHKAGKHFTGDASIDEYGDLAFYDKDGTTTIFHLDGSETKVNIDKSEVTDGPADNPYKIVKKAGGDYITEIQYPDKDKAVYPEYNTDGNIKEMKLKSGLIWKPDEHGGYTLYDVTSVANDKGPVPIPVAHCDDIKIDKGTGDVTYSHYHPEPQLNDVPHDVIDHPDGQTETKEVGHDGTPNDTKPPDVTVTPSNAQLNSGMIDMPTGVVDKLTEAGAQAIKEAVEGSKHGAAKNTTEARNEEQAMEPLKTSGATPREFKSDVEKKPEDKSASTGDTSAAVATKDMPAGDGKGNTSTGEARLVEEYEMQNAQSAADKSSSAYSMEVPPRIEEHTSSAQLKSGMLDMPAGTVDWQKISEGAAQAVKETFENSHEDVAAKTLEADNKAQAEKDSAEKNKEAEKKSGEKAEQEALKKLHDDPKVKAEHDKLEKAAEAKITNKDELQQFKDNMKKFEEQTAALEGQYKKEFEAQGMKPDDAQEEAAKKAHEEVEKTYQNIERLLEKNEKAPVSEPDRIKLAEQCMMHAANPQTISQGMYGTCPAATVETKTFTKDPAEAAKLIADVAITGKYTTLGNPPNPPDGKYIDPPVTVDFNKYKDKDSLAKQGSSNWVETDGQRDYASQLFQVTAVNVHYEIENAKTNPPGQLHYEQHEFDTSKNPFDNGECVIDYSTAPPTKKVQGEGAGMSALQAADMSKHISPELAGGKMDGIAAIDSKDEIALRNELLALKMSKAGIGEGKPLNLDDPDALKKASASIDSKDLTPDEKKDLKADLARLQEAIELEKKHAVVHVHSDEEMKQALAQLKQEGKLPVIISVNTGNEPFWTDSGAGAAGGSGGGHVVTVTDYDEKTGIATMQNQWGSFSSHDVSARDLFLATKSPADNIAELEQEKKAGTLDMAHQYELLRLKRDENLLSKDEYQEKLKDLSAGLDQQQKAGKLTDAQEYELLELKHNYHLISDQVYKDQLEKTFVDNYKAHKQDHPEDKDFKDPDYVKGAQEWTKLVKGLSEEEQKAITQNVGDDIVKANSTTQPDGTVVTKSTQGKAAFNVDETSALHQDDKATAQDKPGGAFEKYDNLEAKAAAAPSSKTADLMGTLKTSEATPREFKPEVEKKPEDKSASAADTSAEAPPEQLELWGNRWFDVQKDGTGTYDVQKGDNLTVIAQDVLKERHADDPNYKPSPAELQKEIDAIATASNLENPNLIHVGDKLVIPSPTGHVVKDGDHVSKVLYPDGSMNTIDYVDGNQSAIHTKNGSWVKQENGSWNYYDKNGNLKDHADNCKVEQNGDFSIKDGSEVNVKHPDGSIIATHPDGSCDISKGQSSYKIDAAGHVTEITYPDGSKNKIVYENGEEKYIYTKNGAWGKEKDGSWNFFDKQGKLRDHADKCTIEHNGDFSIQTGSEVTVKHPDGTFDETQATAAFASGDKPVVAKDIPSSVEPAARDIPAGGAKDDKSIGNDKPPALVEQFEKQADKGADDKASKIADHERAHLMETLKTSGVMPKEYSAEEQKELDKTNAELKSKLNDEELRYKLLTDQLNPKGAVNLEKLQTTEEKLKELKEELKETREKLKKNEAELSDARFKDDMKVIDALPPEKREQIYKSLATIGSDSGGPPNSLTLEQRKELVKEVVHQIAHPEDIKQGYKETCGLATTEFSLAKSYPEKYAKYVAELATTGQTKAADGSVIKLPADVINANGKPQDDGSSDRALVSKVFQTAMANKVLEDQAKAKGEVPSTYVSEMPGKAKAPNPPDSSFLPSQDTGERIISADGKTVSVWHGISADEMTQLDKTLTGESYEVKSVIGGKDLSNPAQEAAAEKDFLTAVEKNGLPCQALFRTTPGDFAGMKHEGLHFVTVTHVDKGPPAQVYFDNTAKGTDHTYPAGKPVPLKEFLEAMQQKPKTGSPNVMYAEGGLITKQQTKTLQAADATVTKSGSAAYETYSASGESADAKLGSSAYQSHSASGELADARSDSTAYETYSASGELADAKSGSAAYESYSASGESADAKPGAVASAGLDRDMFAELKNSEEVKKALEQSKETLDKVKKEYQDDASEKNTGIGAENKQKQQLEAAEKNKEAEQKANEKAEKEALSKLHDDPKVKAEHDKLEKAAEAKITDPGELKAFKENMKTFEEREAHQQGEYQKEFEAQGMKPDEAAKEAAKKAHEEVEKTYQNLEKLLATNEKAPVPEKDRVFLAEQCMQHAADPKTIAQGNYSTCSVASVETRTYTKDPAEAVRLVADMATTGSYTTHGKPPVTVTLDKDSIAHKCEESNELPPSKHVDGHRDYASQIFQVTGMNVHFALENQNTKPPGQIHYEQHPGSGKKPPDTDDGAVLMDYSKVDPATGKKPMSLGKLAGLTSSDVVEVSNQISPGKPGGKMDGVIAIQGGGDELTKIECKLIGLDLKEAGLGDGQPINPQDAKKIHEQVEQKTDLDPKLKQDLLKNLGDLEKLDKDKDKPRPVKSVSSEAEMKETLIELKKEGKLPVVVFVDTGNEPFWSDSNGGAAGGSGAGHFVTITDYDEKTGICSMQNQWGSDSSHAISAHDLFLATKSPQDNIAELDKEKKEGTLDVAHQYELLRLKHDANLLSKDEYQEKLKELSSELDQLQKDGKLTRPQEHELLKLKHEYGQLSDKEYDHQVQELYKNDPLAKSYLEHFKKHASEHPDDKDFKDPEWQKFIASWTEQIQKLPKEDQNGIFTAAASGAKDA